LFAFFSGEKREAISRQDVHRGRETGNLTSFTWNLSSTLKYARVSGRKFFPY
jgi:hypothetical protein